MVEQTEFEGGFRRTYESTAMTKVQAGNGGFFECTHSQLDKPLKIHVSRIPGLAERAVERETAYYLE